jgi:hypothetical protein
MLVHLPYLKYTCTRGQQLKNFYLFYLIKLSISLYLRYEHQRYVMRKDLNRLYTIVILDMSPSLPHSQQHGATTFSITTFTIMTIKWMKGIQKGATTLSIMIFSITIRKCDTQHYDDTQHNDT